MHRIFHDKYDFIVQYRAKAQQTQGKPLEDCSTYERYASLAYLIASIARDMAGRSEAEAVRRGKKRVYYFSLEFLIGRLLDNYLIDLGVRSIVEEGLDELGISLDELCEKECDPGLGNGGLGRLAACFLDSMAHEGIQGYGNGMRYRYGLFRQAIVDGRQVEETDNWLAKGYPWEVRKPESAVTVRFGGEIVRHEDESGNYWFTWEGGEKVLAVPYDVPIVGYGGDTVNKLRIWSAEPAVEKFDLDAFNNGDYAAANKFRTDVEAISTILYPNDSGDHGKILRLKQEYLFVSAGLQTILRTFKHEHGDDWEHFPDFVAIHTNDTHPAMCGPELMRLLIDEEGLDWDEAWDAVTRSISYTNHTVLPEALETWPINTFRALMPRTYMYIEEIHRRYHESFPTDSPNWQEQFRTTAPLWDGQVRMANLSIICSHSVNGVSDLHTNILKQSVLKDFYELEPEKFNNKTNGISHRRFLAEANPPLAKLITTTIGDRWMDDASQLSKLANYEDDPAFLEDLMAARRRAKERLAHYVATTTGVELDVDSVFDVQVKRFHAYKRQLLNVMKVLDVYNHIIDDPNFEVRPTSFIFSGKAAQSYFFAKEVIRLINAVAAVVNRDPRANDKIKVAFIPNFAVSNAQLIYPAADISEQISTAGKEASGTSNMKLMMNGAITLGTYDGANVEICDLAGEDNIKIFGMRVEEVDALRSSGQYWAWNEYNGDRDRVGRIIDMFTNGSLGRLSGDFESVRDELMVNNDQEFVLRDFAPYVQAWTELGEEYGDTQLWARKSLHNIASSGFFSSDRTIREYASEIWDA
ncbi:MAG: glycogen/starch/alpha-glucan phosphorylase [Atopobiaceae bacterium]|nr:glycogen/starch/alpha-glucan phosphorylase [Atopobiaceae bacterium]